MRKHPLGRGREQGKSRSLELSQQNPRRNAERLGVQRRRGVGGNPYEGNFRVPRYKFDFRSSLRKPARSHMHTAHTHHHAYIFQILLSLFRFCCCRLQHRTPDAVFLGAFCSVITIPPPDGNGQFCGSGKGVKLDAFSRHYSNTQYDFFYFGFMSK